MLCIFPLSKKNLLTCCESDHFIVQCNCSYKNECIKVYYLDNTLEHTGTYSEMDAISEVEKVYEETVALTTTPIFLWCIWTKRHFMDMDSLTFFSK